MGLDSVVGMAVSTSMFGRGAKTKTIWWFVVAALISSFTFSSIGHSQPNKWFLCITEDPALIHLFNYSTNSICKRRIAVANAAFVIGGVNFGVRARISENGAVVQDGNARLYIPRGTPVLVLDATVSGRTLLYIWNANVFVLITPYVEQTDKRSFAWQPFDEKFDKAPQAITLRRTPFIAPSPLPSPTGPEISLSQAPAEILSGRVVEVRQRVFNENRNMELSEIIYGKFIGRVDAEDLRLIPPPRLDSLQKYYVGRTGLNRGEMKPCWIPQSISTLMEKSRDLGLSGSLSFQKIAEVSAKVGETIRDNEAFKQELPGNISIRTAMVSAFVGVLGDLGFFTFWTGHRPIKKDFFFMEIASCEGKGTQLLISQGSRQSALDGAIVIRNEEEYGIYENLLSNDGFSDDEIAFILNLASASPRR